MRFSSVTGDGTLFGERVLHRLQHDDLLWLTTVAPDATPQPSPIWFYWDGATILIYSQPNTPKLRNIAVHPRVSLNFQADAHGDDIVIITGQAALDPDAVPSNQHPAYRRKYAALTEHIGYTPERLAAEFSVAVRVTPDLVRGF
ncbi:MAG: TIGR03667 family PPOX class F420-dependent oxidoreductase [Thermomicrobiales bacterium]|nr:TIGR03667 family PPOX class F420-dependent oxidoreductase [Thermomicrobiales bacterium]